jgi:hypothetical protein
MSTNDELCTLCRVNHHEPGARPCRFTHQTVKIPRAPSVPRDIAETAIETVRPVKPQHDPTHAKAMDKPIDSRVRDLIRWIAIHAASYEESQEAPITEFFVGATETLDEIARLFSITQSHIDEIVDDAHAEKIQAGRKAT